MEMDGDDRDVKVKREPGYKGFPFLDALDELRQEVVLPT